MTVQLMTFNLEAVRRAPEGSALACGDAVLAGDADRFSVSGTASWAKDRLGWYPRIAISKKQSTIAPSKGEAELVAALSGACEGMGLRQQWNWLRKSGMQRRRAQHGNRSKGVIPLQL